MGGLGMSREGSGRCGGREKRLLRQVRAQRVMAERKGFHVDRREIKERDAHSTPPFPPTMYPPCLVARDRFDAACGRIGSRRPRRPAASPPSPRLPPTSLLPAALRQRRLPPTRPPLPAGPRRVPRPPPSHLRPPAPRSRRPHTCPPLPADRRLRHPGPRPSVRPSPRPLRPLPALVVVGWTTPGLGPTTPGATTTPSETW